MNLWVGPGKPPENEKWRYVKSLDECMIYLTQHFYKGKFIGVDTIHIPIDISIVHDFIVKMTKLEPTSIPSIQYHFFEGN